MMRFIESVSFLNLYIHFQIFLQRVSIAFIVFSKGSEPLKQIVTFSVLKSVFEYYYSTS